MCAGLKRYSSLVNCNLLKSNIFALYSYLESKELKVLARSVFCITWERTSAS